MRKEGLKKDNKSGIVDDTDSSNGSGDPVANGDESKTNGTGNGPDPLADESGAAVDPFDALREQPLTNITPADSALPNVVAIDSEEDDAADNDDKETAKKDNKPAANGDEDFEVEDIVGHEYKGKRQKKWYQIRWKGYDASGDTWEPEESLTCPDIVAKYLEVHPDTRPPKKEAKPKRPKKVVETVPRDTPKRAAANVSFTDEDDDGNEEYEVAAIVGHRLIGNHSYYMVRWKGYGAKDNTWEHENSLSCDDKIAEYNKKPKGKNQKGKVAKGGKVVKGKAQTSKAVAGTKQRGRPTKAAAADVGYEVQKIMNARVEKGKKFFLIRWKGYSAKDDTWEPQASLNCPALIKEYEKSQQSPKGKKSIVPDDDDDDDDDEDEDYEVEQIVNDKTERGKKFYLVKWKGYPSNDNTWEPATSLSCPDLVAKYNSKPKASPKTPKSNGKVDRKRGRDTSVPAKETKSPKRGRKSVTYADDEVQDADTDPIATNGGDGENEWEVEKVVGVRKQKGNTEYLIRWKGCAASSDTWEPEWNVNCPDAIAKFLEKEPPKRRAKGKAK